MKILDRNRFPSKDVRVMEHHLGVAAVYGDRITIEYHCEEMTDFLEQLASDVLLQNNIHDEPEAIFYLLAPNIQRRRFSIMLYIYVEDGVELLTSKFITEVTLEERRLIVDTILSQREAISDEIFTYYKGEYERWRV